MTQAILLPAAVRVGTTTTPDIVKSGERGIHLVINMTAVPGIDTVTPKIQGKDALGNYYDLLIGAAIIATGIVTLKLGSGLSLIANLSSPDYVPDIWRVVLTHSAVSNFTYSVCVNTMTQ